jgi:hypothetical protein
MLALLWAGGQLVLKKYKHFKVWQPRREVKQGDLSGAWQSNYVHVCVNAVCDWAALVRWHGTYGLRRQG